MAEPGILFGIVRDLKTNITWKILDRGDNLNYAWKKVMFLTCLFLVVRQA